MEIIDKINGNWQVGDKVQTDDGKIGLIQARSDGEFAIVCLDTTHHGDFCKGLIYDFAQSVEELQKNNPKFCKDEVGEWNPGDFIKSRDGVTGLITFDNDGYVCVLAAEGDYAFNTRWPLYQTITSKLPEAQKTLSDEWHKVPSKVILGEE